MLFLVKHTLSTIHQFESFLNKKKHEKLIRQENKRRPKPYFNEYSYFRIKIQKTTNDIYSLRLFARASNANKSQSRRKIFQVFNAQMNYMKPGSSWKNTTTHIKLRANIIWKTNIPIKSFTFRKPVNAIFCYDQISWLKTGQLSSSRDVETFSKL